MTRVIQVPIEPIPARYSEDWWKWFMEAQRDCNIPGYLLHVPEVKGIIETGSFLDVFQTNIYKARQTEEICLRLGEMAHNYHDGNVLFFHDLWHPGVVNIKYIIESAGLNIKIGGILHAGHYDPNDFLARKLGNWANRFERAIIDAVDFIIVATEYHKNLLLRQFNCSGLFEHKIQVMPFRVEVPEPIVDFKEKDKIVVFPHRLDPEKNPDVFDAVVAIVCKDFPDWHFVKTMDTFSEKQSYYEVLRRASIAVSCASQETFGIAMLECALSGCDCIVPNRLSYRNIFPQRNWYAGSDNKEKEINALAYSLKCRIQDIEANPYKWWKEEAYESLGWFNERYSAQMLYEPLRTVSNFHSMLLWIAQELN